MNVFVKIFMTIWLGGVAVIGGPSALVSVTSSQTPAWAAFTPLLMFAFGLGIDRGRQVVRPERRLVVVGRDHHRSECVDICSRRPPFLRDSAALAGRAIPVPLPLRLAALGLLLMGVMSTAQVFFSVFSLGMDRVRRSVCATTVPRISHRVAGLCCGRAGARYRRVSPPAVGVEARLRGVRWHHRNHAVAGPGLCRYPIRWNSRYSWLWVWRS